MLRVFDVLTAYDSLSALWSHQSVQQEKCRKLWYPLTIPISTSSAWIPCELNPWPFPCPWAWVLPSRCRSSSWVHAELWTLLRLRGPVTNPAHRLHRRQEHKTESCFSSQVTPRGVAYCEKRTWLLFKSANCCLEILHVNCHLRKKGRSCKSMNWTNFLT